VINKYHVNHLDFDIEGAAIADTGSINRRFQAINALEANNAGLVVSLTIPVLTNGPDYYGTAFLQAAHNNGTRIDIVNAMTMDYGQGGVQMGDAAISAAQGTLSAAQQAGFNFGWGNIGITPMIGQNDSAGEIFTLDDARKVVNFASSNGVGRLAFWSISRDQPCPGGAGGGASPICSSISQNSLDFTRIFTAYNGGGGGGAGGGGGGGGAGTITGLGGKCVDVSGANTANGTHIQMWDCNGTNAQQWTRQGDTFQALGKCMDVRYGGTANGTTVQLWDCNGTGAQVWQAGANGSLRNPQSGRCLDDPASNTANGTQLIIWDCHGGANQSWTVNAAGGGGSGGGGGGSAGTWAPNVSYTVGQQVTYGGHTYQCLQGHTSQVGWEPPNVPALWQLIS
jgi:chitinase